MSSLSFHYLSMAVHSTIQKNFMEQVKSSGLTSGQPKVLDYLRDHNGANQKEIAAACCNRKLHYSIFDKFCPQFETNKKKRMC